MSTGSNYLLGCGEAFDERGGTNFLEKLGLKILKALVAALGQGTDEINDAARLGRARQHAINGDSGAGDRLGKAAREAIDEAAQFGDADTADVFTEISRETDKQLWLVESHLHG